MLCRMKPGDLILLTILIAIACACAPAPTPTRLPVYVPTQIPTVLSTVTATAAQVSPTSTPVELQTFQYEPFAVTLRYPKDWYPHAVRETSGVIIKLSYPVDNPSVQTWATGEKANIQIWQMQLQKGETFDDWVRRQVNQIGSVLKDAQQRQIAVANVPGVEFTIASTAFRRVSVPMQGFVYNFQFEANPALQIDSSPYANVFNQILSSVKFDATQLAKLANATPVLPGIPAGKTPNLLRPTAPAPLPTLRVTVPKATPTAIPRSPTPAPPVFAFVGLRWEPASPSWGNDVVFYAKFNNTFTEQKYLSWRIEICTPDCPNWTKLMFQTDLKQEFVPPGGISEVVSKPWPLRGKGGLQTYPVRFVHVAPDGTRTGEQIFQITVNP